MRRLVLLAVVLAVLLAGFAGSATGRGHLSRDEAVEDAKEALKLVLPGAWKKNLHNLACRSRDGHHRKVHCPPVYFSKQVNPEEARLIFELFTDLRPEPPKEVWGRVYIRSNPNVGRGFSYRVERCNQTDCFLVTRNH